MLIIEIVIEIKSKLQQYFLDLVVTINRNQIAYISFLKLLIKLFVKFDTKILKKILLIVTKIYSKIVKIRNTVNLRFVTKMLINILQTIDWLYNISCIYKYIRNNVS